MRGNLPIRWPNHISSPCCKFHLGICSNHSATVDMTVLSPELIFNCFSLFQRLSFPFGQHSHQGRSTSRLTLQISQLRPRSAASGWLPNTELPHQLFDGFGPRLTKLWILEPHFHKVLVGIIAISLQIPIETSGEGSSPISWIGLVRCNISTPNWHCAPSFTKSRKAIKMMLAMHIKIAVNSMGPCLAF